MDRREHCHRTRGRSRTVEGRTGGGRRLQESPEVGSERHYGGVGIESGPGSPVHLSGLALGGFGHLAHPSLGSGVPYPGLKEGLGRSVTFDYVLLIGEHWSHWYTLHDAAGTVVYSVGNCKLS